MEKKLLPSLVNNSELESNIWENFESFVESWCDDINSTPLSSVFHDGNVQDRNNIDSKNSSLKAHHNKSSCFYRNLNFDGLTLGFLHKINKIYFDELSIISYPTSASPSSSSPFPPTSSTSEPSSILSQMVISVEEKEEETNRVHEVTDSNHYRNNSLLTDNNYEKHIKFSQGKSSRYNYLGGMENKNISEDAYNSMLKKHNIVGHQKRTIDIKSQRIRKGKGGSEDILLEEVIKNLNTKFWKRRFKN